MYQKVKTFSDRHHMMLEGDRIVAGVSGGADSVCLLLILRELSRQIGFSLMAVHVEHGIRGEESREDAAFTEALCGRLEIPCKVFSVDALACSREEGLSLEEAARELRYNCFFQACHQFHADKIAVAHHAGDSAETMLFHLARGTGIRGLAGIAPISRREYPVIRPLLCVTGEEIRAWLDAQGQAYRTDSTNEDISYTRNRLRRQVMPELTQVNEQAVSHMQRTAEQMREICDFLDEETRRAGRDVWEEVKGEDGTREIRIFCERFGRIHPLLQKHLLLLFLEKQAGSRKDIASCHVEEVLELMTQGVGKKRALPYGMTARRTYDSVILCCGAGVIGREDASFSPCELRIPGETVLDNGLCFRTKIVEGADFLKKIPEKRYTKWLDYDRIKSAVRLRTRQTGDFLQINEAGGHKTLKRYFVEEKVPQNERDQVCLLADNDHVIWVVGYRISEAYKVSGETRHVLQVEVVSACNNRTE
ncbi:MAG: tRNA lysidine(34) synthetase TilS [Clostridiales bacterium]|nr:tRNA lysidine(34) synthetase TilS [Clostridiales bacterium]